MFESVESHEVLLLGWEIDSFLRKFKLLERADMLFRRLLNVSSAHLSPAEPRDCTIGCCCWPCNLRLVNCGRSALVHLNCASAAGLA